MTGPHRAWISWSSGKDSALALSRAVADPELDVVGLLTTVNAAADRVAMHGVRRELLEAQAEALGLPLMAVSLPWPCPNGVYEQRMADAVGAARAEGVTRMVFGDLYLEDIRDYRERMLAGTGIEPMFPLWGEPTAELAAQITTSGIRALLTCVDPSQMPGGFAGRWYDAELLAALPSSVDPCGERGEFHTLAVDGPGFRRALDVRVGDTVERDGFLFTDVLPSRAST